MKLVAVDYIREVGEKGSTNKFKVPITLSQFLSFSKVDVEGKPKPTK